MKNATLCTALLLTLTLLAGCAGAASKPATPAHENHQTIVVQGELTDNGIGCTALRTKDGTIYTFARELEGTRKGAHLRVEGYVVPEQGCTMGVNMMPRRATAVTATAKAALGSR